MQYDEVLLVTKKGVSALGVYAIGVLLAIALIGTASDPALTGEVSRQLKSRGLGGVARADAANVEAYTLEQAISKIDKYHSQGILSIKIEEGTAMRQLGGMLTFKRSTMPVKSYRTAGAVAYGNVQDIITSAAARTDIRVLVVRGSGNPAITMIIDSLANGLIGGGDKAPEDNEKQQKPKTCECKISCEQRVIVACKKGSDIYYYTGLRGGDCNKGYRLPNRNGGQSDTCWDQDRNGAKAVNRFQVSGVPTGVDCGKAPCIPENSKCKDNEDCKKACKKTLEDEMKEGSGEYSWNSATNKAANDCKNAGGEPIIFAPSGSDIKYGGETCAEKQ